MLVALLVTAGKICGGLFLAYLTAKCVMDLRGVLMVLKWIPRDVRDAVCVWKLIFTCLRYYRYESRSDLIKYQVQRYPNKRAIVALDTGKGFTFAEMDRFSDKVAHYFRHVAGLEPGACVGIQMENEIEYLPILFGLERIGVVAACLNTKLTGDSLISLLGNVKCRVFIHTKTCSTFEATDDGIQFMHLDTLLTALENCPSAEVEDLNIASSEPSTYVFTSGTTGLPKCVVKTRWWLSFATKAMATMIMKPSDTVYVVMPMYHVGANVFLSSATVVYGSTMFIRRTYDGPNYFKDCCLHNITVCGFVGEAIRYLLEQPPSEYDRAHNIRVMTGNQCRKTLVRPFKERFAIKYLLEYYGSTEGNIGFLNFEGREGAIGHISLLIPNMGCLVKANVSTGELLRNNKGFASTSDIDEPGLLLGKVLGKSYEAYYQNPEASRKKVLKDVFRKGDLYFDTGDLISRDADGFLYFVDRLGENYKWMGENVSVTQTENTMSRLTEHAAVLMYAVPTPSQGRAGMALVNAPNDCANSLFKAMLENLPIYNLPIFVRFGDCSSSVSGTFKYQKNKCIEQGFNPANLREGETLYYFDRTNYQPLTQDVYQRIIGDQMQL